MLSELCVALEAAAAAGPAVMLAPEWPLQPPTQGLWAAGMAAAAFLEDAGAGEEGLLDVLAFQAESEQRTNAQPL